VPSARLDEIVRGLGIPSDHFHVVDAHPRRVTGNAELIRREIEYHGLSVVVARRACKKIAKKEAAAPPAGSTAPGPAPAEVAP